MHDDLAALTSVCTVSSAESLLRSFIIRSDIVCEGVRACRDACQVWSRSYDGSRNESHRKEIAGNNVQPNGNGDVKLLTEEREDSGIFVNDQRVSMSVVTCSSRRLVFEVCLSLMSCSPFLGLFCRHRSIPHANSSEAGNASDQRRLHEPPIDVSRLAIGSVPSAAIAEFPTLAGNRLPAKHTEPLSGQSKQSSSGAHLRDEE